MCLAIIKGYDIKARRYFSPSLNTLTHLNDGQMYQCPVSESLATRTLCLPLFTSLSSQDVNTVCQILVNFTRKFNS